MYSWCCLILPIMSIIDPTRARGLPLWSTLGSALPTMSTVDPTRSRGLLLSSTLHSTGRDHFSKCLHVYSNDERARAHVVWLMYFLFAESVCMNTKVEWGVPEFVGRVHITACQVFVWVCLNLLQKVKWKPSKCWPKLPLYALWITAVLATQTYT